MDVHACTTIAALPKGPFSVVLFDFSEEELRLAVAIEDAHGDNCATSRLDSVDSWIGAPKQLLIVQRTKRVLPQASQTACPYALSRARLSTLNSRHSIFV
eukprot:2057944-Amphidinium_carterae.1